MNAEWLESLSTGAVYVGVVLLMLVFCEVGYQFGKHVQALDEKEVPASLGPMIGGVLSMFAFVLAITFSITASQHGDRKTVVLEEANAVGTAYLRADLLEKKTGSEVKKLLREYVDIRLEATNGGDLPTILARSVEIHQLLWTQVAAAAIKDSSANTSLVIRSINNIIDIHEKRVTAGLRNRIPSILWVALSAISALAMITMGTQTGLTGKRGLVAVIPLSLAFAVLIVLIVDLDRSQHGVVTVGQQSMTSLQSRMASDVR